MLDLLLRVTAGLAVLIGLLQVALHVPDQLGRSIWRLRGSPGSAAGIVPSRQHDGRSILRDRNLNNGTIVLSALLFAALFAAACYAITPETGYDALSNHLIFVRWVNWNGYWHFDPSMHRRALMPLGAEALFTW
jgi:hypothetical protein